MRRFARAAARAGLHRPAALLRFRRRPLPGPRGRIRRPARQGARLPRSGADHAGDTPRRRPAHRPLRPRLFTGAVRIVPGKPAASGLRTEAAPPRPLLVRFAAEGARPAPRHGLHPRPLAGDRGDGRRPANEGPPPRGKRVRSRSRGVRLPQEARPRPLLRHLPSRSRENRRRGNERPAVSRPRRPGGGHGGRISAAPGDEPRVDR